MKLQHIYGEKTTILLEAVENDTDLIIQVQSRLNTFGLPVRVDGLWGGIWSMKGDRTWVTLNPDSALQVETASEILAEYFADRQISQAANAHEWELVLRLVNGGLNGWDEFWEAVRKFDETIAKW